MAKIVENANALVSCVEKLQSKCLVLQDYINMGGSCEEVSAAYSTIAFEFGVLSEIAKRLKGECWNAAYTYNVNFDI